MRLATFPSALLLLSALVLSASARPEPTPAPSERPAIADPSVVSPVRPSAKSAVTDSITIYGGPLSEEGKFENASGQPDWQGWTPVDRTDLPVFWQVSTSFAENLNDEGAGNRAMWCGRDASQEPGWASAPGYGNDWLQRLVWRSGSLVDPGSAQVVELDFFFNHDVEPFYDFFSVAYDSAGSWVEIYSTDGRSPGPDGGFDAPGLRFTEQDPRPIVYPAHGYGGENGDEIVLRLQVESDYTWSDEDGLFDTEGAVQVDDLMVRWWDEGQPHVSFEGFELGAPYVWTPDSPPYVGNFAKLFTDLTDRDPCSSNTSSVVAFLDDGTPPSNPRNDPPVSTGGSLPTFTGWAPPSYGTAGGWVLNHTGGLTDDELHLRNEIWSPALLWDQPGAEDDGPLWIGGLLEYDLLQHLPLTNGIFHVVSLRSSDDGGASWSRWAFHGFLGYASSSYWHRERRDFTGMVPAGATHLQVSLGVWDLNDEFFLGGNDATPAPWIDDVRVVKYEVIHPMLSILGAHHFQDSFPQSGAIDVSTLEARDLLDVRMDMAETHDTALGQSAGDSLVVAIESVAGELQISDVRLHWILEENPLFEPALRGGRPGDAVLLGAPTEEGWPRWRGSVEGASVTVNGVVVENRRSFDLPDEDFVYPGDRIRYFVEASDSGGNVATLPPDTTGWSDGEGYDERFRVRALPTILEADGEQRKILLIDESGREDAHDSLRELFAEISAPRDFHPRHGADTYVVRAASSGWTNGIGSAGYHGATLAQLAGYDRIVYTSGRLSANALNDGARGDDLGDDLGLLTQWHALPPSRGMAHLGEGLLSSLRWMTAGQSYVESVLGVDVLGPDARPALGDPQTVTIVPDGAFQRAFTLDLGCPRLRVVAWIEPLPGAVRGHAFQGHEFETIAASVFLPGPDSKTVIPSTQDVALTFPFDLFAITDTDEALSEREARQIFLEELGGPLGYGRVPDAVDLPPGAGLRELRLFPNPANPRVWIHFRMGVRDEVEAAVFDVRGRKVRELEARVLGAGPQKLAWDGVDDRGQAVASGVYLVRVRTNGEEDWKKVAIVK